MRSFTAKAALAAILVTAPLGVAYAAHHHEAAPTHLGNDGPAGSGYDETEIPGDPNFFPAEHPVVTAPVYGYAGRLDTIMAKLHLADRQITADAQRDLLSATETRGLRMRENAIRREAVATADRHGGFIPGPRDRMILRQVDRLDRSIARDANQA